MKIKSLSCAALISLFLIPAHLQTLHAQEKRIIEPLSMYRIVDDADPLRFFQPNKTGINAGDLNGDGITDFIKHQTNSADERTSNPDDFLDKTMVYNLDQDGQISATSFYYGALLYPVGDLNNDGRTDVAIAIETGVSFHSFNDAELDISNIGDSFFDSELDVEVTQFVPGNDFDGDGIEDVFIGNDGFSGSLECFIIFGSASPEAFETKDCSLGEGFNNRTGKLNAGDVVGDSNSDPIILSAGGWPYKYQLDILEVSEEREISIDTTQSLGDINLSPSNIRSFVANIDGNHKDDILISDNRYQPARLFQQIFFNSPTTYAAFNLGEAADSLFSPFQTFKTGVIIDQVYEDSDGSYTSFLMNNEYALRCEEAVVDPSVGQFSEACTSVDTMRVDEGLVLFSSTYYPILDKGVGLSGPLPKAIKVDTKRGRFGIGQESTFSTGLLSFNSSVSVGKLFGIQTIFFPITLTEPQTKAIVPVTETQNPEDSKIDELLSIGNNPGIGINFFLTKNASIDLAFSYQFGVLTTPSSSIQEQFKDHSVQGIETVGGHVALSTTSGSPDANIKMHQIMFRLGTSIWMGGAQKSNSISDTTYIDEVEVIDFSAFQDASLLDNIFTNANNIGDINNDNFDDVLFTSTSTSLKGGGFLNTAWGFYGGESFSSVPDFVLDFKKDTTITSSGFVGLGRAVEGLGDINGDGIEDFGIGFPNYSFESNTGGVYVYFGNDEGTNLKAFESPYPDLILRPRQIEGQTIGSFGSQLAGGDFNGDGFNDVAVGSDNSFGSPTPPSVQIFYGGMEMDGEPDQFLHISKSSLGGDTDQLIAGTFGSTIQFLPKEIGKDYQDLLFVPGALSGYPDAAIFDGGMESDSLPDIRLVGPNVNESFGFSDRSKMAAGDINDDGFYDIFMVKQFDSNDAFISSRTYAFSPNSGILPISKEEEQDNVFNYRLSQNYPNPFNPSTNIEFRLPKSMNVSLRVYDLLGREVATLVNDERFTAGSQTINFDASDLASGMYIYRLEAGSFIQTRKMLLIK